MKLHARNDYTQNKQWLTSINRQSHNNNKRGCAEKSSTASFLVFEIAFLDCLAFLVCEEFNMNPNRSLGRFMYYFNVSSTN